MGINSLRCAVIGAGAAGAAAAFALARRGARVSLFDQFAFGHAKGSSHGATRLFRLAYFEHPDYVPILRQSLRLWRELEASSGRTLLLQTGVIEAGPPDGDLISGVRRAAKLHGLPLTEHPTRSREARFEWLRLPRDFDCLVEPDGGYLLASAAVSAMIEGARRSGARLHPDTKIIAAERRANAIELRWPGGAGQFDRIVAAPGAFADETLAAICPPTAGVSVKPVEKALLWVAAGAPQFRAESGFQPFAVELADGAFFYGFPAIDDSGVKVARHTGGAPLASAQAPRSGCDEEKAAILSFCSTIAPSLLTVQEAAPRREESCLYEVSDDRHFLVDRHPDDDRISFAAGLSGHGFKFAPAIGEALAALAIGDEPAPAFEFLSLRGRASWPAG